MPPSREPEEEHLQLHPSSERPTVIDLALHADDRGWLFEGAHDFELPKDLRFPAVGVRMGCMEIGIQPPRFGQVYLVHSRTRGTVRAFHRHQVLWDLFQPAAGAAKFVVWRGQIYEREALVCDPEVPAGQRTILRDGRMLEVFDQVEVVLTIEAPKLLIVPPGWYHGWVALTDGATIASVGSELYDREHPDEERIPYDVLGEDIWKIRNK